MDVVALWESLLVMPDSAVAELAAELHDEALKKRNPTTVLVHECLNAISQRIASAGKNQKKRLDPIRATVLNLVRCVADSPNRGSPRLDAYVCPLCASRPPLTHPSDDESGTESCVDEEEFYASDGSGYCEDPFE